MWSRAELKKKGQQTFNRNYWKCVLVALILALISGGSGFSGSSSASPSAFVGSSDEDSTSITVDGDSLEDGGITFELNKDIEEMEADLDEAAKEIENAKGDDSVKINIDRIKDKDIAGMSSKIVALVAGIAFILVFLVIFAIALLLDAFIFNPLELGCDRFFYKNLEEPAEVAEIAYGFDHGYNNVVRTMFARDIYTLLWTLLFIIPGIVKAYEYRMIPYILAENPDMDKAEVFARSKEMMNGQKWKTCILDLSFIGWNILSLLTIGLLGIFYVGPYKRATRAALYDTLKGDVIEVTDVIEEAADAIVSGDYDEQ